MYMFSISKLAHIFFPLLLSFEVIFFLLVGVPYSEHSSFTELGDFLKVNSLVVNIVVFAVMSSNYRPIFVRLVFETAKGNPHC